MLLLFKSCRCKISLNKCTKAYEFSFCSSFTYNGSSNIGGSGGISLYVYGNFLSSGKGQLNYSMGSEFDMNRSNIGGVNERSFHEESFEVLYGMLKDQMELLQEQKQIHLQQANYTNDLMQKLSNRLEQIEGKQYIERADLMSLERGLGGCENNINESRDFNNQARVQFNRIDEALSKFNERVERVEAAEERFVEVHARLLTSSYYDLKKEILEELQSADKTA